ncbi:unnamed protein product [Phyllotreta striolata]|uniref:RanBD1 domain-containing protein n=1 Tax=Phyllotreta striolata TaxID=444603 RepID=A0A9N9TR00_PHYSR|nr:unnamed protein product [Phyllotreta striolata]
MSDLKILNASTDLEQSESSDTECDLQFKPIISLPEIQVSTNEENETELLKIRAKLYRYDTTGEEPEWKERGTGELKLLRHKETNSVRIVMRRDKTLKVCANHFITPWMDLKPSIGSNKAFVYTVLVDFADEEAKSETLAIKFGTTDNANLFKRTFDEAKEILLTECELYKEDKENLKDNSLEKKSDDRIKSDPDEKECEELSKKIRDLDVTNNESS